ncbi:MAG TPA: FHA domain-containing protein [Kiritimatiellia bacterium]|nr:FHA domain-containing protein [Kiritimatiellia bacterium]HMO98585.1 FHA domain-containing protein [Kiritimatiellia bacterium]HMP95436.1 FHA domain-containing protein [Kiritimatiellia bacterium]
MYRLSFLSGPLKGKRITVQSGSIRLGASADCQIALTDDPLIAPHHAEIRATDIEIVVAAMAGSTVRVNDAVVHTQRLRHGDRITLGGSVIDFELITSSEPPRLRRKFSKMQAVSFVAIGLVIALQLAFVFLFPYWQRTETVQIPRPPPPPPRVETPEPSPKPEEPKTTPPREGDSAVTDTVPSPDQAMALADRRTDPAPAAPPTPPPEAVTPAPTTPPPAPPSQVPALPEPTPADRVAPTPIPDPLLDTARRMLSEARRQIAAGELAQADNALQRIEMLSPDYLPALEERAGLLEKRAMPTEALRLWERIAQISSANSPERSRANAAVSRLQAAQRTGQPLQEPAPTRAIPEPTRAVTPAPPSLPVAPVRTEPARRIRIHTVERERFQSAEDYDEMRLVRIALKPQPVEGAIASERVEVIVQFFDRVEGSDQIVPTRALVQKDGLAVSGNWPPGEVRNVTAAYILKRGFRRQETQQIGERRTYEGYRVTLYYRGELQDEVALPRRIMDLGPPPPPGTTGRR